MSDMLIIEETVGEDGKVILELPPGKHVRIRVEDVTSVMDTHLTPEEEAAAEAKFETLISDPLTFKGLGLTAGEIVKSPEIGIWADRKN